MIFERRFRFLMLALRPDGGRPGAIALSLCRHGGRGNTGSILHHTILNHFLDLGNAIHSAMASSYRRPLQNRFFVARDY